MQEFVLFDKSFTLTGTRILYKTGKVACGVRRDLIYNIFAVN